MNHLFFSHFSTEAFYVPLEYKHAMILFYNCSAPSKRHNEAELGEQEGARGQVTLEFRAWLRMSERKVINLEPRTALLKFRTARGELQVELPKLLRFKILVYYFGYFLFNNGLENFFF